ncbi:MAG TPA: pyridoxal phosphate-dependent aminotransferase family protein [bacterium]|nr:pyridoxal phosphate-dependent aminotransferase family protein [bacterium]HPP86710.1 pyridoxal phosphate-dependent aminotransferase family protein [bacterium]
MLFDDELEKLKKSGLYRTLKNIKRIANSKIIINNRELIDFSSNDYLGFSAHPQVIENCIKCINTYGIGAGAARLMSGNNEIYCILENLLKNLFGKERALIFGSGFLTNSTVIPAITNKNDLIISDKLAHSSIIHGIKSSDAQHHRFKHNDMNSLESILKKYRQNFKNCWIITESIFSMDGDICPLNDLIYLKEKYNCFLYLDESHSFGLFADNGAGLAKQLNCADKIEIIMATFSKAVGSYGGFIVSSHSICEYLINKARGFIFSTALPPVTLIATITSIKLFSEERERIINFNKLVQYTHALLKSKIINTPSASQIIPIIIGDAQKTIQIAESLISNGFYVLAIRPPTVPQNTARIRISINYHHSKSAIENLIEKMIELLY